MIQVNDKLNTELDKLGSNLQRLEENNETKSILDAS